jgi:hypothetical protein
MMTRSASSETELTSTGPSTAASSAQAPAA